MQAYSDPTRESEPYSLPDVEVFFVGCQDFMQADPGTWMNSLMHDLSSLPNVGALLMKSQRASDLRGWYWWSCFPGCLPDGDPNGPFDTEALALADAQDIGD